MFRISNILIKPVFMAILVALMVIGAASTVAWQVLSQTRIDLEQQLQSNLKASISQAKQELEERKTVVRYWAGAPSLIQAVTSLVSQNPTNNDDLQNLKSLLSSILESQEYRGYKIIDKQGLILASDLSDDVGQPIDTGSTHGHINCKLNR